MKQYLWIFLPLSLFCLVISFLAVLSDRESGRKKMITVQPEGSVPELSVEEQIAAELNRLQSDHGLDDTAMRRVIFYWVERSFRRSRGDGPDVVAQAGQP